MDGIEVMCPRYHYAVELIGARWSGAILRALLDQRRRYADIKAAIPGLSDTMLARRLRELEGEGLLEREVVPTSPVRVEYALTEKGRALAPVIEAVVRWAEAWVPASAGEAAPERPSARARRTG